MARPDQGRALCSRMAGAGAELEVQCATAGLDFSCQQRGALRRVSSTDCQHSALGVRRGRLGRSGARGLVQ